MRLSFICQSPRDSHYLICFCVVDSEGVVRLVVSQKDKMTFEVDSLPTHVVTENLPDWSFHSYVPEINTAVPSPACHYVVIFRVPFQAEDSVVMLSQVTSFNLLRFSLVEQTESYPTMLSWKSVMSSFRADFACLKHFVILSRPGDTFLEKRSCPEVACQY